MSDGRILVEDEQAAELHLFDPSGMHIVRVGGRGQGPGEFQNLTELSLSPSRRIAINGMRFPIVYPPIARSDGIPCPSSEVTVSGAHRGMRRLRSRTGLSASARAFMPAASQ
ncbi:MAG: 6-bladed beta-propeller [Gemmatimonadales bacterium]